MILLILNNITSLAVVLACWWIAHLLALGDRRDRVLAAVWGVLGLLTAIVAVFRNIGSYDLEMVAVVVKAIQAAVFFLYGRMIDLSRRGAG